jgi:cytochrome c peroxidase
LIAGWHAALPRVLRQGRHIMTYTHMVVPIDQVKPHPSNARPHSKKQVRQIAARPATGVTMDRSKPVQEGARVKLIAGATWDSLAAMTPEQIRDGNLFPPGFLPLPHPKHQEGGMVFPRFQINEIKRQEARDLTRFDVDYDIPDHFLPEFPPAIYLNQRSDLGDVSQGQLVTIENYYQLFNGIINPKQLEGLRLLVTPFPQQQFNQTEDRRWNSRAEE